MKLQHRKKEKHHGIIIFIIAQLLFEENRKLHFSFALLQNKKSDEPTKRFIGLCKKYGGDEEDRTPGLTDANRTRSQLRYAPKMTRTV